MKSPSAILHNHPLWEPCGQTWSDSAWIHSDSLGLRADWLRHLGECKLLGCGFNSALGFLLLIELAESGPLIRTAGPRPALVM